MSVDSGVCPQTRPPRGLRSGQSVPRRIEQVDYTRGRSVDKLPPNFLHIGFNQGHSYADRVGDLGWYHNQYDELMCSWYHRYPGAILDVECENTVNNVAGTLAAMLKFLGLPWDVEVLDFSQSSRGTSTISKWQVRYPIYKTSVNRWRPHEKHLTSHLGVGERQVTASPAGGLSGVLT